jgi:hypothetical protein
MQHVVMYSGGTTSWATAMRVREMYPDEKIVLLFADTKIEDDDLHRFLWEGAGLVEGDTEYAFVAEGRDPWQVFRDVKLLGNTHHDPCSRVLKREFLRKWLNLRYQPDDCVVYIGYDWTEIDRWKKAERFWAPYSVECPLIERPSYTKADCNAWALRLGLELPRLTRQGFAHNNCGGFCVKGGRGHFKKFLAYYPERYELHEAAELIWQQENESEYTILRDRRGGETNPMTLRQWREQIEAGKAEDPQIDLEMGGCGCFDP